MASIFRTVVYIGTETMVFRTGLNTSRTGLVSAIPRYILGFSRKLDTGLGKKKENKVNLTHSNLEILLLTPIWDLFILVSHW